MQHRHRRFGLVLLHEDWGIYLGCSMGLGFWSILDPVGQDMVPTFDNMHEVIEHIQSWTENNNPENYSTLLVEIDNMCSAHSVGYTSFKFLAEQGFGHLLRRQ